MTQWLHKRGEVWHYRFELNKVPYSGSTGARDMATAKQVLAQVRSEIVLGEHGIRKAPTLGAVIEAWLRTRGRSVSDEHRLAAEKAKTALEPLLKLPLTHITTVRVEDWRSDYLQTHSPATVNMVMRYLKLFCRWAMKDRLIKAMPYSVKMLDEPKKDRPIVEKTQRDEFFEAVNRINPQIPAAATFTMNLGVREAEMLNSRWEWLTAEEYHVRSKTKGKRDRVVAVPQMLLTAIGWMLTRQTLKRQALAIKRGDTTLAHDEELPAQRPDLGLIFPGAKGKAHQRGWLNKALKRGAIAIGVPTLGNHRLRATFGTLHLRNKAPLKEVQEMMGHRSAMTTLIYQETSTEEQKKHQNELWA
jgi:integrase